MVKVVAPLRIHAHNRALARTHHAGIVEVTFGNQKDATVEVQRLALHHRLANSSRKVGCREIEHGMDGVETQGIDMKVAEKVDRILDKVAAHLVAAGAIQVDRCAPRRLVAVGEVGAILAQIVALGAQVVVDHIQDHRDPAWWQALTSVFNPRGPP